MRKFDTGATRDDAANKPDYEGYLSPLVIARFGRYMLKHQEQADGSLRDSDNWQNGIPLDQYMKSKQRHDLDAWLAHRGWPHEQDIEESLCAVLFNTMGYLHEVLKAKADSSDRPRNDDFVTEDSPLHHYDGPLCRCPACERKRFISRPANLGRRKVDMKVSREQYRGEDE